MDRTRVSVVAAILVFGVMSTRMASAQLSVVPINHLPSGNIILGSFDRAQQARPVVQAVQSLFHPPFELPAWPDGKRQSRIVFITRGLSQDFVREVLATIQKRPMPRADDAAA